MNLTILIPCFNDEKTIENVIAEAKTLNPSEIIVIDDGSTDSSVRKLRKIKNITLIIHQKNQGYGKTIKELYYAARSQWLFTVPGDYQIGAKEIVKLLPSTKNRDMIIGWRKKRKDPMSRLMQSKIYAMLLRFLFGVTLHDVNSVRLMKKEIFQKIHLMSNSAFVDAELAIFAKKNGFTTIEIPVSHRAAEKTGGGGKWWTILPTIFEMIKFKYMNSKIEDKESAKELEKAIAKGGKFVDFFAFDKKRRKDLKI